jgi:hypothetical protein
VHLRTIQINHEPNATNFQFIILTFVYSSTCFGRFPAHHQELNDLQWQALVLPSYRGDSRTVFVFGPAGRPARSRTHHVLISEHCTYIRINSCLHFFWVWVVNLFFVIF